MRLLEVERMSVQAIATNMRLSVKRVQRFIEEEADYRELARLRCDEVPVERIRQLVEEREAWDSDFTLSKLGELAGFTSRIELRRVLGYSATAASSKNGKRYPGRFYTTIGVGTAGRIVRALGYSPSEIKDL